MRFLTTAVAVLALGSMAIAQEASEIGKVRRVNLEAEKPKVPPVAVGDLVQVILDSPSAGPQFMISKMKVKIDGDSLEKVAVVDLGPPRVDGKPVIGSTRIAVVLTAGAAGKSTVELTPVNGLGKDLESKSVTIDVKEAPDGDQ